MEILTTRALKDLMKRLLLKNSMYYCEYNASSSFLKDSTISNFLYPIIPYECSSNRSQLITEKKFHKS